MAPATKRTKIEPIVRTFSTWPEVDQALAEVTQLESQIKQLTAEYNEKEIQMREEANKAIEPKKTVRDTILTSIQLFCADNRVDFGDKQSKELTNGILSFRKTPGKVSTLKGFTFKAALNIIKTFDKWKEVFTVTKEDLNKEAILQRYDKKDDNGNVEVNAKLLEKFGLEVTTSETFGYELKEAIS